MSHGATCILSDTDQLSPDEQEYVALAQSLVDDGRLVLPSGDAAKRMPLYPALLAGFYATQEAEFWRGSAQTGQAVLAMLTTLGVAAIAARLGGARAGLIAGIVAAIYAPFLHVQGQFLSESLALFLLVAAIRVYLGGVGAGATRADVAVSPWLTSILLGLLILTRANAALFVVPFAAHAALRGPGGTPRLLRAAALVLPAGLMTAAWMVRNQLVIGAFSLSSIGGLNFYLGHNPGYTAQPDLAAADYGRFDALRAAGMGERDADQQLYREGFDYIRNHPGDTIANLWHKTAVWLTPTTQSFGPSLVVLLAAAMVVTCRRAPRSSMPWRLHVPAIVALVAAVALYGAWLWRHELPPLVGASYLLWIGIPSLILVRMPDGLKWLLIGIVLCQYAVALAFIPLSRLRWSIDVVFIIAAAVGCAQLCDYLRRRTTA